MPFPIHNNFEKFIETHGKAPFNVPEPEYNIKLYTLNAKKVKGTLALVTRSEIEKSLRN